MTVPVAPPVDVDSNTDPVVSVGLPVYNGEVYLQIALDALLAQTFKRFELIISDNASTDGTRSMCERYAAMDSRIQYHRNETNLGSLRNFERVFELARAPFFMWAAHDDAWHPEYIERCLATLNATEGAVLACADVRFIDERGETIDTKQYRFHCRRGDLKSRVISMAASRGDILGWFEIYGIMRTDVMRRVRMPQNLFGTDVIFLMEMFLQGSVAKVEDKLFYYRKFSHKSRESVMEQLDASNVGRAWPRPYSDLCGNLLDVIERADLAPEMKSRLKRAFLWTLFSRNPRWLKQIKIEQLRIAKSALRTGDVATGLRAGLLYGACAVGRVVGKTNLLLRGGL